VGIVGDFAEVEVGGKEQFHFSPTAVSENVGALVLPQVESEVAIGPHLQRGTCWCGLSDYLQKGCGAMCFVYSTRGSRDPQEFGRRGLKRPPAHTPDRSADVVS
jgi:hypothetical protein